MYLNKFNSYHTRPNANPLQWLLKNRHIWLIIIVTCLTRLHAKLLCSIHDRESQVRSLKPTHSVRRCVDGQALFHTPRRRRLLMEHTRKHLATTSFARAHRRCQRVLSHLDEVTSRPTSKKHYLFHNKCHPLVHESRSANTSLCAISSSCRRSPSLVVSICAFYMPLLPGTLVTSTIKWRCRA